SFGGLLLLRGHTRRLLRLDTFTESNLVTERNEAYGQPDDANRHECPEPFTEFNRPRGRMAVEKYEFHD
ncbi:MAG: hypothetical protein EBY45_04050, partial [Gammaproteobacteria bacterium]|nr:hypothetical protein [Gammaproteobacteria bacterium]